MNVVRALNQKCGPFYPAITFLIIYAKEAFSTGVYKNAYNSSVDNTKRKTTQMPKIKMKKNSQ